MYRRERQHGHSALPAESTGPHRRIRFKNTSSRLPGLLNSARGGNSGVGGRRDCSCDDRKVPSQGPLSGENLVRFFGRRGAGGCTLSLAVPPAEAWRAVRQAVAGRCAVSFRTPERKDVSIRHVSLFRTIPCGAFCLGFPVRRFGRGTAYGSRGEMLVLPLWFRYSKGGPLRPSISRVPSPGRSRRAECRTIRRFRRA